MSCRASPGRDGSDAIDRGTGRRWRSSSGLLQSDPKKSLEIAVKMVFYWVCTMILGLFQIFWRYLEGLGSYKASKYLHGAGVQLMLLFFPITCYDRGIFTPIRCPITMAMLWLYIHFCLELHFQVYPINPGGSIKKNKMHQKKIKCIKKKWNASLKK